MKTASFTRAQAAAMDAADPLATHRARFVLPKGIIYLDGNSLGPMPKAAAARIKTTAEQEWAKGLIRSWNDASWLPSPRALATRSPG